MLTIKQKQKRPIGSRETPHCWAFHRTYDYYNREKGLIKKYNEGRLSPDEQMMLAETDARLGIVREPPTGR